MPSFLDRARIALGLSPAVSQASDLNNQIKAAEVELQSAKTAVTTAERKVGELKNQQEVANQDEAQKAADLNQAQQIGQSGGKTRKRKTRRRRTGRRSTRS